MPQEIGTGILKERAGKDGAYLWAQVERKTGGTQCFHQCLLIKGAYICGRFSIVF
jgi:hypothetical protein